MSVTITEALAEIKTLNKRLEKKREFVLSHTTRDSKLKDPLEKSGGSESVLGQERQSITGLEGRIVRLRNAINVSNQTTTLTVAQDTRPVAEWLTWRREVMPSYRKFLVGLNTRIQNDRDSASYGRTDEQSEIVVNVDELALGKEAENLEEILGSLDGQLSLLNATTTIEAE